MYWPLPCLHKFFDMCIATVQIYTWRLPCVPTGRSDTHVKTLVYRGLPSLHKKSCARTISLARLPSEKLCGGGGTCHYHPHASYASAPHLWNIYCDSLCSPTHVSLPTVSFSATKPSQRCSECCSRLYQPSNCQSSSPSRFFWEHRHAFPKVKRRRKPPSSARKTGHSSGCSSPEERRETYASGGLQGLLLTVSHLTSEMLQVSSYNKHCFLFLSTHSSQEMPNGIYSTNCVK